MIKNTTKRSIIIIAFIFSILLGMFSPSLEVLADLDEANKNFNREVDDYLEGQDEITDVLEKMMGELKTNPNPSKNTMSHVMKRIFGLGIYINDVEYGVLAKDLNVTKDDIMPDGIHSCNPDAPNNLINHNCNIPNFTTSLFQNIIATGYTPFTNATKTSSHATFGLGVPNNIPGGEVPINPADRQHTYTALELFGYDLKLTAYNGEWDRITVSSESRMLSNFGVIDRITLMGTTLWNSVKTGIGELIQNFSFNPFRWTSMISKSFQAATSSGINTVIDTSDLNVVATNAWKRESFSNTLYNVYVMTDKEVMDETARRYFTLFNEALIYRADNSEELKKVLALEIIPGFTFIEDWETEESIAAREAAESHNASESSRASSDPEYSPSYVTVPDPVYYTEKEQLGFWAEDNSETILAAAEEGLISANPDDYETYDQLVAEWNEAWALYFAREFDASGLTVQDLLDQVDADVLANNPHLDPKQGISHYACANPDGSIMREGGKIEYLYLNNNKGSSEYVNPKCGKVRAPLNAGLFGNGWHIDRKTDTRHVSHISEDSFGLFPKIQKSSTSFGRSFSSFIAKITNVVIGFSFSPILNELGIDTIISELVASFRDTIFFPMAALAATIGGILLFIQVLKNGTAAQFLISIFATLIIFIAGSVFLMQPEATINLVDKWPSEIDNFIANRVLADDDGTIYCSTGNTEDGIRSAQCNVWGAMVFNPWVHLQFGTSYENLYANGYGPPGAQEMKNTNESLVGNAEVNQGGGVKVNNWALYQLSLTKSGTITTKDKSNKQNLYNVDKNMYRIVDMQAGPNDGEGTDPRYFDNWSGATSPHIGLSLLTIVQSIFMSIALIGLGFTKIEASFMFAISILFLPFMLLYAFLPQGKIRLRSYLSNLVSLLMIRVIAVMMFAVLLKAYNLIYSQVDSLEQSAVLIIALSATMIAYRKEIITMITSTEGGLYKGVGELKDMAIEGMPMSVKQRAFRAKSAVRGMTAGGIGGAIGYMSGKRDLKNEKKDLERNLEKLNKKEEKRGPLSEAENRLRENYRRDIANYEKYLNKNRHDGEMPASEQLRNETPLMKSVRGAAYESSARLNSIKAAGLDIFKHSLDGARSSSTIIGRTAERKIRRDGHSLDKIIESSRDEVLKSGADSITDKEEPIVLDTYRELLSHSELNKSKTSDSKLTMEEGRLLSDPKIQREVRKLADKRRKATEENRDNKDRNALLVDKEELEKLAELIDKKRKAQRIKGTITAPFAEKTIKAEAKARAEKVEMAARAEDDKQRLKKELEDRIKMEEEILEEEERRRKGDEQ